MPIKLAISGAAGKMGRRIIALADQDEQVRCVAALEREGAPEIGKDAGECRDHHERERKDYKRLRGLSL